MRQVVLFVLVLLLALPVSADKRKFNPNDYQNINSIAGSANFTLALHQDDFTQNLARGVSRLRFLADVSPLLTANTFPTSFQVEIFKVVNGQRESLAIYRPTVLSQKKAQNFTFDIDLVSLTQTSNIEIDVYDVRNQLNTVFKTDITIQNPSDFAFSTLSNSSCQGDFGECQLEYIVKNIQFATGPNQGIETKVEKNPDGSYLVSLPLSKSNRATRIINRINGNSSSGSNSNLNFEFDGTNLFVVADDGTKTQVAAQGPQGEAGPTGNQGPPGAQGPQGPTGVGIAGAAGSDGQIQFNTGGSLSAEGNLIWNASNKRFSITEANPTAKLHVRTNTGGFALARFHDNAQDHQMTIRSMADQGMQLDMAAGDKLIISTDDMDRADLVVDTAGNVGLGTFDPLYPLQVNGNLLIDEDIPTLRIGSGDEAGPKRIIFTDDPGGSDTVQLAYRTSSNILGIEDGSDNSVIFSVDHDDDSAFFNGNVGIGVTANGHYGITMDQDILMDNGGAAIVFGTGQGGPFGLHFVDNGSATDINLFYRSLPGALRIEKDTMGDPVMFSIDADDESAYFNGNLGVAGIATPLRSIHIGEAMRLEPQASPPASPSLGDIYVDDSNAFCIYIDSAWTKITGTGTCS